MAIGKLKIRCRQRDFVVLFSAFIAAYAPTKVSADSVLSFRCTEFAKSSWDSSKPNFRGDQFPPLRLPPEPGGGSLANRGSTVQTPMHEVRIKFPSHGAAKVAIDEPDAKKWDSPSLLGLGPSTSNVGDEFLVLNHSDPESRNTIVIDRQTGVFSYERQLFIPANKNWSVDLTLAICGKGPLWPSR
jgi:hypothetical protein